MAQPNYILNLITIGIFAAFFLYAGIYSLKKKELPMLGFPEWFEGSKGKMISIAFILVGVLFALAAAVAPDAAMALVNRGFRSCNRR